MTPAQIPASFYEAARRMHAMHSLTQAMLQFVETPVGEPEQSKALLIISGLLDAQEETVAALQSLINTAEEDLMRIGLHC